MVTSRIHPQFESVLKELQVDEVILKKLAKHDERSQRKIFSACKDLFKAELMFVLMHLEANKENHLLK